MDRWKVTALVVTAALVGVLAGRECGQHGAAVVTVSGTKCPPGFRRVGVPPRPPGEMYTRWSAKPAAVVCVEE
jgi:hypothetical protein